MKPVVVTMEDERLKDLSRAFPELTYSALHEVRLLLQEAEASGRVTAAENLGPEIEAIKAEARQKGRQDILEIYDWKMRTMERVLNASKGLASEMERFYQAEKEAAEKRAKDLAGQVTQHPDGDLEDAASY